VRRSAILVLVTCACARGQRTIDTVAGGLIQSGVPASSVELIFAPSVTGDSDGNLYFGDDARHAIRKIRSDGIIETVAGTGISRVTGDGGLASTASLVNAGRVTPDDSGNLFFIDSGRIRRIDSSGKITTVAGTGILGSLGADGPAVSAQIDYATNLAVGLDGTLYFMEPFDNRVRALTPDGRIVLVAGAPLPAYAPPLSDGDGGPAISAHLNQPTALSADRFGNVYVVEHYLKIRRIMPDGTIATFAGNDQFTGAPGQGDGGPAKDATFGQIVTMASDAQGSLFIGDCASYTAGCLVRRVGTDGIINTIAGGAPLIATKDGPAASVHFNAMGSLFVDSKGNIYFGDGNPGRIRRITPQSMVETIAGASPVAAPDGPDARKIWLLDPIAIASDRGGNLYIAESGGCRIRKVTASGAFSTVAGTGNCSVSPPQGGPVATTDLPYLYDLAVNSQGVIYAASPYGDFISITPGKTISPISGVGRPANAGNLVYPSGRLAVDSHDRLYIMTGNSVMRLGTGGAVEMFAGPLANFSGIAVDASDNVYICSADGGMGRVIRITQDQHVSGLQLGEFLDSIAVDAAGKLFGTESGSSLVGFFYERLGNFGFGGDGGPLASASLNSPSRLIFSSSGDFYFIDRINRRVRKISGSPPSAAPVFSAAGLVNAASGTGPAIAPGELISIYGSNLGPSSGWFNVPENNAYRDVAGYTRVLFDGGYAPILFATANQINAFVPSVGQIRATTMVQVEVDGVLSAPVVFNVAKAAFGLFTANSSGSGQGAILNQDGSYNGPSHPAERGSFVSLYGTGEGSTTPYYPIGALVLSTPYPAPDNPVTVSIGGQPADVQYAGAAPFLPAGILQINVRIPNGVTPGDAPVVVSNGGVSTTRAVTVAVR
jgi:uncharacterized protein (TIGR03437 family)